MINRTSECGSVGATSGRGVSVGVTDGVGGTGVMVKVDVTVAVGLGLAVWDGVAEGKTICGATGAQAPRKRRAIKNESFCILRNANR